MHCQLLCMLFRRCLSRGKSKKTFDLISFFIEQFFTFITLKSCPQGYVFDSIAKRCVQEASCRSYACESNGYFPNAGSCSKFWICVDGTSYPGVNLMKLFIILVSMSQVNTTISPVRNVLLVWFSTQIKASVSSPKTIKLVEDRFFLWFSPFAIYTSRSGKS